MAFPKSEIPRQPRYTKIVKKAKSSNAPPKTPPNPPLHPHRHPHRPALGHTRQRSARRTTPHLGTRLTFPGHRTGHHLRLPRRSGHNDWYHLGRRLLPGLQLALPGASLANLPAIRLGSLLCLNLPPATVHAPPASILPARSPRPLHRLPFFSPPSPPSPR